MKNRSLVIIACIFFSCTFLYSQEKTQSPTSDLSPTAAFWKEAYEKTFFGINGTKTFHIPADLETTVERRIKLMKELGVLWDRSDWWWHIIEPRQGEFDFSTPDNILKYFEERHIQIYPILCYGAAWWKERNAPLNDEEIEQFANYVSKTVERYKGSFKYWSIWNEPNILPFWAPEPNVEQYAKLLKKAYKAAKNADPDCVICAPVVAPVGQWDKKFVGRLLQLGCMDSFDVFDYHYYRNNMPEKEVSDEIADIKAFMRRYGEEKPIWISESGVSALIENKPDSYHRQAALVVRNHLLSFACGVQRFFYFDLQNWNDTPKETWDSKLGLIEAGWTPKPSYHAYRTMVKEVDYKKIIGRCPMPDEELEAVLIYDEKHNDYILAAWLARDDVEKKTIEFVCKTEDIKIVHPYGDVEMRPLENPALPDQLTRTIIIEIDRHPRFIHYVDDGAYLPKAGVRLMPEKIYMNPTETKPLKIHTDSLLGSAQMNLIEIKTPKGFLWDADKGEISCGDEVAPGIYEVSVSAKIIHGKKPQTTKVNLKSVIEILPATILSLRPYLDEGKSLAAATITNQSPWELSGRIRLESLADSGSELIAQLDSGTIKAGETKIIEIPFKKQIIDDMLKPSVWRLRFRQFESKPFHIYLAPFVEKKPIVDGNLEEWINVPRMEINRKEQIVRNPEGWSVEENSGFVKIQFTKDNVFIAADVLDDDPVYNPHPPNMLWKGDMIELYLGLGGPAKRTILNKEVDFQIGIAPTYENNKPIVFLFHADRVLEDAKAAYQKSSNGYTIEASIPLSALGKFEMKPGDIIGLDAAINDLDKDDWAPIGNEPGRAIMWNGSASNWIDPSGWGMAIVK